MQGLQPLIAFADTARHGGFAAAAREAGVAPSTLAKAVARLERSLGVKLFHRTTRQVRLTPDGERLYLRCQRVLVELEELQAEASGARAEPSGLLRVDNLETLLQLLEYEHGIKAERQGHDRVILSRGR